MLLILTAIFSTALAGTCNKEMQQGPFVLESYKNQKIPISKLEIEVERYTSEERFFNMLVGFRSFWKSYCYQGGALDSNTGCYNSLNNLPPDKQELKVWYTKSQCSTGSDISDAWGSDSDICNKPQNLDKWHDKKELKKEVTNNHFAHHTCTISWRCGHSASRIPLELKAVDGKIQGFFVLPNGTEVVETNKENFWSEGGFSYLITRLPELKVEKVRLGCFFENNTEDARYWCLDSEKNLMFRITGNEIFCESTVCYSYSSNKTDIKSKHSHSYFDSIHKGEWQTHAASLQDLQLVINAQYFEVENLRFNLAELDHRFSTLTDLFNGLVSSVAKIDDRLLGNLLNTPVASKFLSKDQFLLYPCTEPEEVYSNCHGNTIFQDGRWVHNEDASKCIELGKHKPINIYQFNPLWMPTIIKTKVQGLIQDLEGWSFVASSKKNLEDTMLYTRNGGSGTSIQDILDYPAGWINSKIHSLMFGGGFICVVLIIVVIVIIKILKTIL